MSLRSRVISILKTDGEQRASDLAELTGVSRQMIHRVINDLLADKKIIKLGRPPKTFYTLDLTERSSFQSDLGNEEVDFLESHYLLITETGQKLTGTEAMNHWCLRQKLPVDKTAREYIATRKKYLAYYQSNDLLDGKEKLQNTKGFNALGLDDIWYMDFYAIERFGKTKLGLLLHFAKQGQNKKLMEEIVALTGERLHRFIQSENIDAIGYIPPTIKRELQIMTVLRKKYNVPLTHIDLVKVTGEIAIPQKALNKIGDRINNANASIMVAEKRSFQKVLLIDDAVGSGATLNQTALKIKEKGIAKEVIGLAITGSFKGFEVIQEV